MLHGSITPALPWWVRAAHDQAHLWLGGRALPEAAALSGPGPAQDTVLWPDLVLFAAPHDLGHVCDHGRKSLACYSPWGRKSRARLSN